MLATVYEQIKVSYSYVEHACAVAIAINDFGPFEVGKRIADACLIGLLITVLFFHFGRKVAGTAIVAHAYRKCFIGC